MAAAGRSAKSTAKISASRLRQFSAFVTTLGNLIVINSSNGCRLRLSHRVRQSQTNRGGLIPPVLSNAVTAQEYSPTLPGRPGTSRQAQTAKQKFPMFERADQAKEDCRSADPRDSTVRECGRSRQP
jgi:hypothetical protein